MTYIEEFKRCTGNLIREDRLSPAELTDVIDALFDYVLDPESVLPRHHDSEREKALTRSSAWRVVTRRENERSRATAR